MKTINISIREIDNGYILSNSGYDDSYASTSYSTPKEIFVPDLTGLNDFVDKAVSDKMFSLDDIDVPF